MKPGDEIRVTECRTLPALNGKTGTLVAVLDDPDDDQPYFVDFGERYTGFLASTHDGSMNPELDEPLPESTGYWLFRDEIVPA